MKNAILMLSLLCSFALSSQVKEVMYKGEKYFVYPFQEKVRYTKKTFTAEIARERKLYRDSLNQEVLYDSVKPRIFINEFRSSNKRMKKYLRLVRKELPEVLCEGDFSKEAGVTPSLKSLPDGKYIVYYRDVPFIDKENILSYKNDIPCAIVNLKNNLLDGKAVWMDPCGRIIKEGSYTQGMKTGEWHYNSYYFHETLLGYKKFDYEEFKNSINQDTSKIEIQEYKNGVKHGKYVKYDYGDLTETGFFEEGEESGEWIEYDQRMIEKGKGRKKKIEFVQFEKSHYTYSSDKKIIKAPLIRELAGNGQSDYGRGSGVYSDYYEMYSENEEPGLELPEEKYRSYPGEEERNLFSGGTLDRSYDRGTFVPKWKLMDSIGYVATKKGLVEERYYDGQLRMRFNIVDGKLIEPDTIFTRFGTPESILQFDADSSQWILQQYNTYSENPTIMYFKKNGEFIREKKDVEIFNQVNIKGLTHKITRNNILEYYNWDTLQKGVYSGEVVLTSLYYGKDTVLASLSTYNADQRRIQGKSFNFNGEVVHEWEMNFTEDLSSFTGKDIYKYDNFSCNIQSSGTYSERYKKYVEMKNDTVFTARLYRYSDAFDITKDEQMYYKDQLFTGNFSLTQTTKKFKLKKSGNTIYINYHRIQDNEVRQMNKRIRKFSTKGRKGRNASNYSYYMKNGKSGYVVRNIFDNLFSLFDVNQSEHFYIPTPTEDSPRKRKRVPERKARSYDKKLEGQLLDGKNHGVWRTSDQYNRTTHEITFVNGEEEGEEFFYKMEYPNQLKNLDYYSDAELLLMDTTPEIETFYLSDKTTWKNGMKNGESFKKDWTGAYLTKENYTDGDLSGPAIERNKLVYQEKNYEYGSMKGIQRTYLTIPNKDSVLLFDLNFADGYLQGESKTYHLNGKIARQGFFLGGQPIQDFEAYDTLGFKYQYVKFLYNQPVEEKIWEENALSVRYIFDWKDSVEFNPGVLTSVESLERMAMRLGLQRNDYSNSYMGRPSMLNKSGVDYQLTKFYPNDTIARDGRIEKGKKVGHWDYFNLKGEKLYEVEYADTILQINDSVRFKSKGILTYLDKSGKALSKNWIVEKVEKYDCSHTDHHEVRMLYCFWEKDTAQHRMNGYVKNYYDNGVLMNEGKVTNGLATGIWKFYDPYGNLNMVGEYVLGKRNGRWLKGDLGSSKYMGDICLNPNLPNIDEILAYEEKVLDISILYYKMSKELNKEYYGINMNSGERPEGSEEDDYGYDYYGEYGYEIEF